ncbi:6-carboxytetrahydropterin synthase QueD [bacterium]|nr:6-carboxytetrahydropterin synthase QueD [bacterium]MBU1599512.1 6-carboxytetrahydropterin synthase QueD [bacterium]MBU2461960.1 6-carboxytetrahydropterin synthase QueD [bacterium]
MYTIAVEDKISCAHSLLGYNGECARVHGHNFEIAIVLKRQSLDTYGMVADFKEIKKRLRGLLEKFDHQNLNDIPPFDKILPTSENIASFIYRELKISLPQLVEVRVSEQKGSLATYSENEYP